MWYSQLRPSLVGLYDIQWYDWYGWFGIYSGCLTWAWRSIVYWSAAWGSPGAWIQSPCVLFQVKRWAYDSEDCKERIASILLICHMNFNVVIASSPKYPTKNDKITNAVSCYQLTLRNQHDYQQYRYFQQTSTLCIWIFSTFNSFTL